MLHCVTVHSTSIFQHPCRAESRHGRDKKLREMSAPERTQSCNLMSPEVQRRPSVDAYIWNDCREERSRGILATCLLYVQYLVLSVAVAVTLMLNERGAEDLHLRVGVAQVIHCRDHVQGVDLAERSKRKQIQPKNLNHLIMSLHCCCVW